MEPLLSEDENRLVTFPIKQYSIWEMYRKLYQVFGHPKKLIYLKI